MALGDTDRGTDRDMDMDKDKSWIQTWTFKIPNVG
jgi:hypothetical protein